MSLTLWFAIWILFFWILRYLLKRSGSTYESIFIREINEAEECLRNSDLDQRAPSNQRLAEHFGIKNSFTTTDQNVHRAFVSLSKDLLRTNDLDWRLMVRESSQIIRLLSRTRDTKPPPTIDLVQLTQTFVFRCVLLKFFGYGTVATDVDVLTVTRAINDIWMDSKRHQCSEVCEALMRNNSDIKKAVRNIFQCGELEDREGLSNPLNIILPAYETLWRVVLRCFLEVRFRSTQSDLHLYQDAFKNFHSSSTKSVFQANQHGISVEDVVAEALRLYPPTRRIYRDVGGERYAVDVEYVQRDPELWGPNSLEFNPRRWNDLVETSTSVSKVRGYMPFGFGKFVCPAQSSFAPRLIGLLVAALLLEFGQEYELVDNEALMGSGMEQTGPLSGERCALRGLTLKVRMPREVILN